MPTASTPAASSAQALLHIPVRPIAAFNLHVWRCCRSFGLLQGSARSQQKSSGIDPAAIIRLIPCPNTASKKRTICWRRRLSGLHVLPASSLSQAHHCAFMAVLGRSVLSAIVPSRWTSLRLSAVLFLNINYRVRSSVTHHKNAPPPTALSKRHPLTRREELCGFEEWAWAMFLPDCLVSRRCAP